MSLPTGNDNSKINIPVSGSVATVPLGTTIAYGADAAIPTAIVHGRVNADGVTINSSSTTTKINGWPESDMVANIVSEGEVTVQFSLLQIQEDANLEFYFNTSVNAETGGYHFNPGEAGEKRQVVIDTIDKVNKVITRYYFPEASVTERGEIKIAGDGLVEFSVTLTAFAKTIEGQTTSMIYWTAPYTDTPTGE